MGRGRVGTKTMGFSLIVLGLILLTALIGGYPLGEYILKLWPILLILLGAEVLFHIYRNSDGTGKVYYDLFSMVMIFVIFISSLSVYFLTASDLINQAVLSINVGEYDVVLPKGSISVGSQIKKIVVNAPARASIELNGSSDEAIYYSGRGTMNAVSKKEAESFALTEELRYEAVGEVLYLDLPALETDYEGFYSSGNLEYVLSLPQNFQVEVKGTRQRYYNYSEVIIAEEAVKGQWLVESVALVRVKVNEKSDFNAALIHHPSDQLDEGQTLWTLDETGTDSGYVNATAKFGQGTHSLVIDSDQVDVITIPSL